MESQEECEHQRGTASQAETAPCWRRARGLGLEGRGEPTRQTVCGLSGRPERVRAGAPGEEKGDTEEMLKQNDGVVMPAEASGYIRHYFPKFS